MAKGEITFYFDTLADLRAQLEETLGLGGERMVTTPRATSDTIKPTERAQIGKPEPRYPLAELDSPETVPETARGVSSKLGDGMTFKPTPETAAPPQATPTTAPQEAAKDTAGTAVLQQEPVKSEGSKVKVTLENLADTPYGALLAFCEQNPGVGVNVTKCTAAFFRTMVEHKVRVFLETTAS